MDENVASTKRPIATKPAPATAGQKRPAQALAASSGPGNAGAAGKRPKPTVGGSSAGAGAAKAVGGPPPMSLTAFVVAAEGASVGRGSGLRGKAARAPALHATSPSLPRAPSPLPTSSSRAPAAGGLANRHRRL